MNVQNTHTKKQKKSKIKDTPSLDKVTAKLSSIVENGLEVEESSSGDEKLSPSSSGRLQSSNEVELAKMNLLLETVEWDVNQESNERMPAEDEEVTVFVSEPSANLLCPIHKGLFSMPVIAKCGHTFCRNCLLRYVETGPQQTNECPLDKTVIKHEELAQLIPNLVVAQSIQGLKIFCKYGCKLKQGKWIRDDKGCPQVIHAGKRSAHEETCPYSTCKCPFGDACPPIRRMQLDEHMKSCARIPCPHGKVGCTFLGGKDAVAVHLKSCAYETVKGYIQKNKKKNG